MAKLLAVLGRLAGCVFGVALLPVGLVVFYALGYAFVAGRPFGFDPYLAKPYGVLMMAVGAYWLWLGTRLIRGLLAVTADLRRFLTGNLCLLFACVVFFVGVAAGSRDEMPADAAALPFAAGALWLWTALRLLAVDGAPAAGLVRFVAGNVLTAAALACAFASAGGQAGPGAAIVLVAGLALLVLAVWLLRLAAPRQLPVADEAPPQAAAAVQEQSAPPDDGGDRRLLKVLLNMFLWMVSPYHRRRVAWDWADRKVMEMQRGKADAEEKAPKQRVEAGAEEKDPEQPDAPAAAKNGNRDGSLSRDNRRVAGFVSALLGLGLWVKGAAILFVVFFIMQDPGEAAAFAIFDPDLILSPPVWAGLGMVLGVFCLRRCPQFISGKRAKVSNGDMWLALASLFILVYVPVPLP